MAIAFAALLATIVIGRFLADRRRGREERQRPQIEVALAEYLAAEDPVRDLARESSAEEVLREADEALYRAKGKGRNRVEISGSVS